MRAWLLAFLLLLAAVLVVVGVAGFSVPAAWVVGGLLLGGWSLLVFGEVS